MTVSEQSTITRYTSTGLTANFSTGFEVFSASEINVYIGDVLQSTTLWSYAAGKVVFVTIPPAGSVVSIQRVLPLKREISYTNNTNQFLPKVLDADLDQIWRALQDIKTNLSRALALPISDQSSPFTVLADLRTWLEVAKNLADDTALPRLAEIETALDNLSARLTQVEFDASASVQLLQVQVDALVFALSQVGGGAKAYQTEADLIATGAPTPATQLAYVLNDTDPAKNGLYGWTGGAWAKSPYDPLAAALAAVADETEDRIAADNDLLTQINGLLASVGLITSITHDLQGRRLLFSVVDLATSKQVFSVDSEQGVFLSGIRIAPGVFKIEDALGRRFLSISDGALRFFNSLVTLDSRGFFINDRWGRTLAGLTYAGGIYLPSLGTTGGGGGVEAAEVYKAASLTTGQHKLTQIIHYIFYGQSLSRGTTQAAPPISTVAVLNNIMLAGGVLRRVSDGGYNKTAFAPMVEATWESPVSGCLNGLATRFNAEFGTPPKFLGSSTGNGGRTAEALSPAEFGGTESWFENTLQYVRDCKALADSLGETYSVWGYDWIQGESDSNTPAYLWIQRTKLIKQELDKGILAITGKDFLPVAFMHQTAAHRHYGSSMRIALAQLRLARNYPDFVLCSPTYIMPTSTDDYLHLTNEGSWLMGQYHARAIYETQLKHVKYEPLMPIDVQWSGTQIDIKFNNRTPLVIDTALCAATHNSGFDIWESGAVNTGRIVSVAVVGTDTVRITLDAAAATDAVLTYARGRTTDPAHAGPVSGARGNVRDSAGLYDSVTSPSSTVYALHNASVMWQYSRKDGFNAA